VGVELKLANRISLGVIVAALSPIVSARGVSPYLPLDMSPAMERQIERVLILAGKPVMRRPIAAAIVLDALPAACERDQVACEQVRKYLQGYMKAWGVTTLEVQGAVPAGDSNAVIPNSHGERVDSPWRAGAHGYWQPNDYILVNAGGIAYDGNATPTGSFLSVGFDWAQLDMGFRDHWYSPFTDSASLISTEAPTMPSVTLSNYRPLTPLGISYEVFGAEMSNQDGIVIDDAVTSGTPRVAGLHVAMEPVTGYGLAISRITQYGGGARNRGTISDFKNALFESSNMLGTDAGATNRVAALTSSIQFPGKVPFAVHVEYAGEDNAFEGRYRLGATNFSLGIDFPILWRNFDLSFEASEWQNSWYVHYLYPKGLVNEGRVLGHWFGDNREFGDAIGGNSFMLRAGWRMQSGDYLQARFRTLSYDERWRATPTGPSYDSFRTIGASYSTLWRGHPVEAELIAGQDVYGESFLRLSAAFDFIASGPRRGTSIEDQSADEFGADVFVDVGAQHSKVREVMLDLGPNVISGPSTNYHTAVGARRPVSERSDLGVRLEFDRIEGFNVISVRALDYRFRFNRKLAITGFVGAARYDIELPAYGYYGGVGLQYLDVFPKWDIGLDYRYYEKLTRDKVLPSDPPLTLQLPRRSLDIKGFALYLSRRW
jgi:hypothetical protein